MQTTTWRVIVMAAMAMVVAITTTIVKGEPACLGSLYCDPTILSTVQLLRLFNDSKTFVDMPLRKSAEQVLESFLDLPATPSPQEVRSWITENFAPAGSDVSKWTPPDWSPAPPQIMAIPNPELRAWALELNKIWFDLGKQIDSDVRDSPDMHSLIPIPHPFIVPGGRFREVYYWDSFWIVKGLLVSSMWDTAKGMIQNLLWMVQQYGFVPNGARVYYKNRSQPPVLTLIVKDYYEATHDLDFLRSALPTLVKEWSYWTTGPTSVRIHNASSNKTHVLNRYWAYSDSPRPEGYAEDVRLASGVPESQRPQMFRDIATAAASGWDFSSRWFADRATFNTITTTRIIPVDLNAILYKVETTLAELHMTVGDVPNALAFQKAAANRAQAIHDVLWDSNCDMWTDCLLSTTSTSTATSCQHNTQQCGFYSANFLPLWSGAHRGLVDPAIPIKTLKAFHVLEMPGGVPVSLYDKGEQQWDFPSAWPNMHWFVVESLLAAGYTTEATEAAHLWVNSNHQGWKRYNTMFEKYDSRYAGQPGDGGEYDVVLGFGWTNGVILDFLTHYTL